MLLVTELNTKGCPVDGEAVVTELALKTIVGIGLAVN